MNGRTIDTRLRTKRGRLVAECRHCYCPEGCACSPADPCGCGTPKPPSGLAGTMLAMARNSDGEVHVAWPKEKAAVVRLERLGLVTVRRTTERCGGLVEWWYRLATKEPG